MATQEATVTVRPVPLDAPAVNKLAESVDSDFVSGDFPKAAGSVSNVLHTNIISLLRPIVKLITVVSQSTSGSIVSKETP